MNIKNANNSEFFHGLTKVINQISTLLFSFFLVFLLVWLFLLGVDKYDGDELFYVFFYAPFINPERIKQILLVFVPFLLGSIAVWICFQVGLINLGVGGQMSATALSVFFVAFFLKKAKVITADSSLEWLPLFFLVGVFAAVFLAFFCGSLRIYFGINEFLSTIFTNYIVFYLFRYLIGLDTVVNPVTKLSTAQPVGSSIAFNVSFGFFSVGFVLVLVLFLITFWLFSQTKFGFQTILIGKNKTVARYSGININQKMMAAFLFSGFLAGLAGLFYYYRDPGNTFLYKSEALPSNGYDTIMIVWLSQGSLTALPFASFFLALLRVQQKVIKLSVVDPFVVDMIIGLIILFVAFLTKIFNDQSFLARINQFWQQCYYFISRKKQPMDTGKKV